MFKWLKRYCEKHTEGEKYLCWVILERGEDRSEIGEERRKKRETRCKEARWERRVMR